MRLEISSFSDLLLNKELSSLFLLLKKKKVKENLLFSGPPGTGKTSFCKFLLDPSFFSEKTLYLESKFSKQGDFLQTLDTFCSLPSKEHKQIFFEEAELLSENIQKKILQVMDKFSKKNTFIFICNSTAPLCEPLKSRCLHVIFPIPQSKSIYSWLNKKIKIKPEEKEEILQKISFSRGDMRQLIKRINSPDLLSRQKKEQTLSQVFEEFKESEDLFLFYSSLLNMPAPSAKACNLFFKEVLDKLLSKKRTNVKDFFVLVYEINREIAFGADKTICILFFFFKLEAIRHEI